MYLYIRLASDKIPRLKSLVDIIFKYLSAVCYYNWKGALSDFLLLFDHWFHSYFLKSHVGLVFSEIKKKKKNSRSSSGKSENWLVNKYVYVPEFIVCFGS